nr:hypothetical protein Iba_chr08dCG13640 [Ipomoea batatas]
MMNDIRLWSRRSVSRLLRRMKVSNVHELPVACKRRVTWDVANLTANTAATTLPSSPLPSVIATSTSIHVAGAEAPAAEPDARSFEIFKKGVGSGLGTSSSSTTKILRRSSSSIETSSAGRTSFCIARRPLVNAQVPNSYIRSSPMGVRETAARTLGLKLLDPLVPLRKGLFEWGDIPTVDLVSVLRRANKSVIECAIYKNSAVDQPLVCYGGDAAAQILVNRAAGGSSPVLHKHVDHRRCRTRAIAVCALNYHDFLDLEDFSFPRLALRAASFSPLGLAGRVAARAFPVGTDASLVGFSVFGGLFFLDAKLILVPGPQ